MLVVITSETTVVVATLGSSEGTSDSSTSSVFLAAGAMARVSTASTVGSAVF